MSFVVCPSCGAHVEVAQSTFDEAVGREVAARLKAATDAAVEQALVQERQVMEQEKRHLQETHALELARAQASASSALQAEIAQLKTQLAQAEAEKVSEVASVKAKLAENETVLKSEISTLKSTKESEIALAKLSVSSEKDKEISALKQQAILSAQAATQREEDLKGEIQRLRDMRSKLSTKMLGESLEQHCMTEFLKVQSMGAFPNATFVKDNVAVSTGTDPRATKGDFIYREVDEFGEEFLSIMFEMKTEAEDSRYKKTNDAHFAKLDQDRKKKGCEFAVLVSTLEGDNDIYNAGIVDVTALGYDYEKMYVVRPQVFIPMISILRGSKAESLTYKRELKNLEKEDFDILGFKKAAEDWVSDVNKSGTYIKKNIDKAIDELDKAIAKLENTKAELTRAFKRTTSVENKVNTVSVEKLASKFDSVKGFLESQK